MNKALVAIAGLGLIAATAIGVRGAFHQSVQQPSVRTSPEAPLPKLAVLTSLPILFGETFGQPAEAAKVRDRLALDYDLVPIAVADAANLKGQATLLIAHPRAQPAEALVDLDHWVRDGGRVVLLADPKLDWPSERALGDRLRPPPDFADTGLLQHWGLTLSGPSPDGSVIRTVDGGTTLSLSSPGVLQSAGDACRIADQGLVADCALGKGRATVIADADLLDVNRMSLASARTNVDWLVGRLHALDNHQRIN